MANSLALVLESRGLDSLPPAPPPSPPAITADAPGDIYPRSARERELCEIASRPDYWYLGGLLALDVATFWGGVQPFFKYQSSIPIRFIAIQRVPNTRRTPNPNTRSWNPQGAS